MHPQHKLTFQHSLEHCPLSGVRYPRVIGGGDTAIDRATIQYWIMKYNMTEIVVTEKVLSVFCDRQLCL